MDEGTLIQGDLVTSPGAPAGGVAKLGFDRGLLSPNSHFKGERQAQPPPDAAPLSFQSLAMEPILKGEVPSQRTDFVIQGLEVGVGTKAGNIFGWRGCMLQERVLSMAAPQGHLGAWEMPMPNQARSRGGGSEDTVKPWLLNAWSSDSSRGIAWDCWEHSPLGPTRPASPESASYRGLVVRVHLSTGDTPSTFLAGVPPM